MKILFYSQTILVVNNKNSYICYCSEMIHSCLDQSVPATVSKQYVRKQSLYYLKCQKYRCVSSNNGQRRKKIYNMPVVPCSYSHHRFPSPFNMYTSHNNSSVHTRAHILIRIYTVVRHFWQVVVEQLLVDRWYF
jgi:hypothetical protein